MTSIPTRCFLCCSAILLLLTLLTLGVRGCSADLNPPNVVLIIADTLRADKMGTYGFPADTSPELDALADQGILFERVISPSSWTRPGIGSLLTGHYPRTLGIYDEQADVLDDSFTTLAEVLQDGGYCTYGITANPNINSTYNFAQGFDTYVDSSALFRWMKNPETPKTEKKPKLSSAKEIYDRVLSELPECEGRPKYLQINIMEMHEYMKKGDLGILRPEYEKGFEGLKDKRYLQALRQVSADTSAFIESLVQTSGWEDTLFIFTSDHGEGLSDHRGVWFSEWHGRHLYQTHILVPLFLYRSNNSMEPKRITEPVRLLDLFPTLLDYLNLDGRQSSPGVSLWPLVEKGVRPEGLPEYFVAETEFQQFDKIAAYGSEWVYIENEDYDWSLSQVPNPGVPRRELHEIGIMERGTNNDRAAQDPDVATTMRQHLRKWNRQNPRQEANRGNIILSDEERSILKSIGYLQ